MLRQTLACRLKAINAIASTFYKHSFFPSERERDRDIECVIEEKMTYFGYNIDIGGKGKYGGTVVENKEACAKLSFSTKGAKFWSYLPVEKLCWVKTSKKGRKPHPTAVSGNRACGKPGNQMSTFNCAVTLVS